MILMWLSLSAPVKSFSILLDSTGEGFHVLIGKRAEEIP